MRDNRGLANKSSLYALIRIQERSPHLPLFLREEPIIRPCIELYGFVPVHKVGDMSVVKNNLRVVPFAGRMYFYRVEVR